MDKNFRIVRDAYPYVASRLLTDSSDELQAALLHLLFQDGKLKLDRFEDLLENAAGINDYDFSQAIDQLLTYLAQPKGKEMREAIAAQIIEGFDALESEIVGLLLTYVTDPELILSTTSHVVSNVLHTPAATPAVQRLDLLLEQILDVIDASTGSAKPTVMLKSFIKVIRILTRSILGTNHNGLISAKNTLAILKKVCVFCELLLLYWTSVNLYRFNFRLFVSQSLEN